MQSFRTPRCVIALVALGATAGSTAVSEPIDHVGFSFATIDVYGSPIAATNRPSVLKLMESDSTVSSTFADIVTLVGDGVSGFIIPNWSTAAPVLALKMCVDCRARKRYLRLSVSPRVQQDYVAVANLLHGEVTPYDEATANVLSLVEA